MLVAGLRKTSLVDFPPHLAATVFTPGCNFRCGFCHNASLVPPAEGIPPDSASRALEELGRRRRFLDAVCVTGGEPTLQPGLSGFLDDLKRMGYLVKLDTNGSRPETVADLLARGCVDHFAVDVKTCPERYRDLAGDAADPERTRKTVRLLRDAGVSHELRLTAAPGFSEDADADALAEFFGGASPLFLQPFRGGPEVLSPAFRGAPETAAARLEALAARLAGRFARVAVRA